MELNGRSKRPRTGSPTAASTADSTAPELMDTPLTPTPSYKPNVHYATMEIKLLIMSSGAAPMLCNFGNPPLSLVIGGAPCFPCCYTQSRKSVALASFHGLASQLSGTSCASTSEPLCWLPPPSGHYKLNIDAGTLPNGTTTIGGILRDNACGWKCGFMQMLPRMTVLEVELRGHPTA